MLAAAIAGTTAHLPFRHSAHAAAVEAGSIRALPVLSPAQTRGVLGGSSLAVRDGVALVPQGSVGRDMRLSDVAPSDRISLYIVREGDTLSQIAAMFGVSINTIRWANNLTSADLIKPGQELLILPIDGVRYTVRKGDTLQAIARRFHGDVREIITYNDLSPDEPLRVGMTIVIPGGEIPERRGVNTSRLATASSARRSPRGYFLHPLPGGIRTQGLHGWNAVDIAAPFGTPIRASAPGTVLVARANGWNGGYGVYVVIRHPNGTQTLYAHMSRIAVFVGQTVVRGQVIGYVGSTGRSTGPHLHFEVRGARNPFGY